MYVILQPSVLLGVWNAEISELIKFIFAYCQFSFILFALILFITQAL